MAQTKHIPQEQRSLRDRLAGRVLRYTRAAYRHGMWADRDMFLYVLDIDLAKQQLVMLRVPPCKDGSFPLPRNGQRERLRAVQLPLRSLHFVRETTLAERAGDRYVTVDFGKLEARAVLAAAGGA